MLADRASKPSDRSRRRHLALALAVAAALPIVSVAAADLRGKVVGITDGDTVRLLVGARSEYKIRLGEIDAPENGQPFGRASKRMLSDLVFGKTVTARVTDIDRYGRSVAVLTSGRININSEMVRRGGAWAYRRYLSDQRYLLWETEARQALRGLWGLQPDQVTAPWDWRAARRGRGRADNVPWAQSSSSRANAYSLAPAAARACGVKWKCGQISSCEDARFQLRVCGLTRLDGDGDGVPCEKLCG